MDNIGEPHIALESQQIIQVILENLGKTSSLSRLNWKVDWLAYVV